MEEEVDLQCPVCTADFSKQRELDKHLKTHGVERPYKCNVCTKTFRANRHFAAHKLVHGPRSKHPCQVCGKLLATAWSLKTHMCCHHPDVLAAEAAAPPVVATRAAAPSRNRDGAVTVATAAAAAAAAEPAAVLATASVRPKRKAAQKRTYRYSDEDDDNDDLDFDAIADHEFGDLEMSNGDRATAVGTDFATAMMTSDLPLMPDDAGGFAGGAQGSGSFIGGAAAPELPGTPRLVGDLQAAPPSTRIGGPPLWVPPSAMTWGDLGYGGAGGLIFSRPISHIGPPPLISFRHLFPGIGEFQRQA